jgi:hypothetical protein
MLLATIVLFPSLLANQLTMLYIPGFELHHAASFTNLIAAASIV